MLGRRARGRFEAPTGPGVSKNLDRSASTGEPQALDDRSRRFRQSSGEQLGVDANERDAERFGRGSPCCVVEREQMSFAELRRLAQPFGSHREGRAADDDEIFELVGDVRSAPSKCTEKDIAHFVKCQIDHTTFNFAGLRRVADGAGLDELGLTFAVKPLDEHRGVDEERRHGRVSRYFRTSVAASNLPAARKRCSERAIASATATGSRRANSLRAAVARSALRLMDLRRASSSMSRTS